MDLTFYDDMTDKLYPDVLNPRGAYQSPRPSMQVTFNAPKSNQKNTHGKTQQVTEYI